MAIHFLQTEFWARFKREHGWSAVEYRPRQDDGSSIVYVLVRRFGGRAMHFSMAYIPMAGMEHLTPLAVKQIRALLPRDTLFIRSDADMGFATCFERDEAVVSLPQIAANCRKSRVDIQPPDTVLLDLVDAKGNARSEEDLLKAMKSKWRYNIRLAQKKGVEITAYRAGDERLSGAIDVFYSLYEKTAARDRIAIHPKEYYSSLLNMNGADALVTLYIARHEGDSLATIITIFTKDEATYLYGASGNVKRNLMGTYLLQWQAIKDAMAYGDKVYDFYGIPPVADESHPMAGLYLFKTGFGGREVHRIGSVDVPLSPLYALYAAAERLRAFWYKRVRKAFRSRKK